MPFIILAQITSFGTIFHIPLLYFSFIKFPLNFLNCSHSPYSLTTMIYLCLVYFGISLTLHKSSLNNQPYRLRAIIFCGAWNHLYQGVPRGVRSMRAIKYGSSGTIRNRCYWRNHCIPIYRKRHTLRKKEKGKVMHVHSSHCLLSQI